MRSTLESSTPIKLVVVTTLLLSQVAAQVNQIDKAEQIRVKKLIEQVRPAGEHSDPKPTNEQIKALSVESVPVLIDFALNQDLPYDFRERAFLLLKHVPDERVLDPFTRYYRDCRVAYVNLKRPCEFANRIHEATANYYVKTKDERALTLYIEVLTSDEWPGAYKFGAVQMLTMCKDLTTASILKQLVINNNSYPYQYHKALAARAIAETGDEGILPNLIQYAHFLLDDAHDKGEGRGLALLEGLRGLAFLAGKNEKANQSLQRLMETFVSDATHYYIYRDRSFPVFGEAAISALASVGREENIRLVERLLSTCDREPLVRQMIRTLGEVGDERTIGFLEGSGRYPDQVQDSILQIKQRQANKVK